MSRFQSTLLIWVAFSACTTARTPTERLEAEVRSASDQVWVAHERGDALALAALVTEDAVLMVPGFPDVVGRSAIQAAAEQMFASTRISDFHVKQREIKVISDMAYELAWYSETLRAQAGSSNSVDGRYLIVWKRGTDNRWQIHRNLFNFASAVPHP